MANKCHKLEEIVTKLRQLDVLVGQGMSRPDAKRHVGIAEQTDWVGARHQNAEWQASVATHAGWPQASEDQMTRP